MLVIKSQQKQLIVDPFGSVFEHEDFPTRDLSVLYLYEITNPIRLQ